ncbi:PepSY domain-containing protein [Sediminicoccus rosea]|uniref:PepSY domain-containing protein n=1 Tax=Sediminicoccus rosea TaxID=1225128 RepID=A0ABZ0PP06_9PROT|nr:PepSY domain-containing protein [Sediminicoccus rosea]WPB86961.1 PepSY domain-containing protein [Sediminicoccus rosea]
MIFRRALLGLPGALPLLLAAEPARADGRRRREEQERVRRAIAEGRIRPLSEILALVRPQLGGEVIGVELDEDDGVFVYEIKVLTRGGRRRELQVDAATGRILKVED